MLLRQRHVRVAAGDRLGKTPPPATQAARGCMVTQRAAEKSAPQHFVVVPIIIDHQLQLLVGAWLARRYAAIRPPSGDCSGAIVARI